MSHQVLGMAWLKKKYLKHQARNKCIIIIKEDQDKMDVLEFLVKVEHEVVMEYM